METPKPHWQSRLLAAIASLPIFPTCAEHGDSCSAVVLAHAAEEARAQLHRGQNLEGMSTTQKPLKHRSPQSTPSPEGPRQLVAMVAACIARDLLKEATLPQSSPEAQAAEMAHKRKLHRDFQARLAEVLSVFKKATDRLCRLYRGQDHTGAELDEEDLRQSAIIGVSEAVARFDAARGLELGGCVSYVLSRVRYELQKTTGSTRIKQRIVGLDDLPQ